MKPLPMLLAITTALGLGGSVYFFMASRSVGSEKIAVEQQLSSAEQDIDQLEDEKTQLEKDLIYYKNTDLAKEVELLNLKLQNAERDFAATNQDLAATNAALTELRRSIARVPTIADILSMMMAIWVEPPPECFQETEKGTIRQELDSFGDPAWTRVWNDFIQNTDSSNCSMTPEKLRDAVEYGLDKISQTIK